MALLNNAGDTLAWRGTAEALFRALRLCEQRSPGVGELDVGAALVSSEPKDGIEAVTVVKTCASNARITSP